MAIEVKVIHSSLQMHREQQAHETEEVIAMKVANEDVVDPVKVCLMLHQLNLSSFSTVDQEITAFDFQELG